MFLLILLEKVKKKETLPHSMWLLVGGDCRCGIVGVMGVALWV